ncbi:protein-tyrosine phosphatase family protein [Phaeobacter sp.]|uniref:protein-tyrosine phosphatase family protein n=1 Tax=Phaeobacter sp. TaxID=1902409 RepID=UPI0025E38E78|nr:protein-tyrosine phosphatase family protein [Phaeobacter sp.]
MMKKGDDTVQNDTEGSFVTASGAATQTHALVIHALSAADGILALCPLPGAGGDYAGDMAHIHDWQPGFVISMTTTAEHERFGAASLGADLQGMGCRWVHLPVPDYSPPPPDVLMRWPEVSHIARKTLVGGGRVLVHCRGGCGRSGMVVLRLMIELGERPASALERLRSLRPCAVETDEQMAWAYGPRRIPDP